MPKIHITTSIKASAEVCFDLSRSIDLHLESTKQTGETAIAGKKSGLIDLNETVTWRANHFGIWQTLTSKITVMDRPYLFVDEMVNGAFKSFRHEHVFTQSGGYTMMTDTFTFESPLGVLGRLANVLFLTRYMTNLLIKRNEVVKANAELNHQVNKNN